MSETHLPPPPASSAGSRRYQVLDILRGFALCGILLVNIGDITRLGGDLPVEVRSPSATENVLYYLVSTRFVPIFAILFGMSMVFVADSARRRGASPGPVLCRRFGALLLIGLAHGLVYPGEVLREFAVAGLLLVPVVLFAPRRLVAALGVFGTVAMFGWLGATSLITAPLFLLGAAAVRYGITDVLERPNRLVMIATALLLPLTVAAVIWQTHETGDPRFGYAGGIAGGIQALLYICLVCLACATPLRRPLAAVLEPLGRMSLTCYVTASVIVASIGAWANWSTSRAIEPLLAVAVVVLVGQSVGARLWLRYFRYGPIEWAWRCVTWWRPQPLVKGRAAAVAEAEPQRGGFDTDLGSDVSPITRARDPRPERPADTRPRP